MSPKVTHDRVPNSILAPYLDEASGSPLSMAATPAHASSPAFSTDTTCSSERIVSSERIANSHLSVISVYTVQRWYENPIQEAVLGKRHMEVAVSLQQAP